MTRMPSTPTSAPAPVPATAVAEAGLGLRERKKLRTRQAIREAARRLIVDTYGWDQRLAPLAGLLGLGPDS